MRRASQRADVRPGVRRMLGVDPTCSGAMVRALRRSVARVAAAGSLSPVRALPARPQRRRSSSLGRRIRRRAARDPPRAQVRRPPITRRSARAADACSRRRTAAGRVGCGSRSAASVAAPRPRLQPGGGSRHAPGSAVGGRAAPRAGDGDPGRSARRTTPRERERRVRGNPASSVDRGIRRRSRRRCEHDGRHARRVRTGAEGSGRCRGARDYGGPSRDVTTVNTSSAMTSFGRSPSSTIHAPAAA